MPPKWDYFSKCMIVAIFMILQIKVAFAPYSGQMVPSMTMNNAPMSVTNHQPPPSAMALASLPHLNDRQKIGRLQRNDLPATEEVADGEDFLARHFGVPREFSRNALKKIKEEEGKDYMDSPFAKFADMEMPEKVGKKEDEHKDRLMKKHKHNDHDDEETENVVEEFGAHNGNGLTKIDENAVANTWDGHRMAWTISHEDVPIQIREKDPRRVNSDPPANQGDAARRIRLFNTLGGKFKRRATNIVRQKASTKDADFSSAFLDAGKKERDKLGRKLPI